MRLKQLREDQTLSVRELADRANVAHTTIVRLENHEEVGAHPRTIRKLASALGVEPKALKAGR